MKRRYSLVCVGYVGANEFDWRRQMMAMRKLVEHHGTILTVDAGKMLGFAQYAADMEDALREAAAWFEQWCAHGGAGTGTAATIRNRLQRLLPKP